MAPRIILTGYMGAGKSTAGKRLARELGWEFIDTDKETESEMGMDIPRAFKEIGENGFRKAEARVITSLLEEPVAGVKGRVISLGGGAVTINKVRELLKNEPLVFFLKSDIDVAYKRVHKSGRPLATDPESFRNLYRLREPLYLETASHVVEAGSMKTTDIAGEIIRVIREGGY